MTSLTHRGYDISLFIVVCHREQTFILQRVAYSILSENLKSFKEAIWSFIRYWWRFSGLWKLCKHSKIAKVQDVVSKTICFSYYNCKGGNAVMQWFRHRATNQKFTGSIPDGVTGIFHWHNPSGRTMVLGLTQPLTEKSTRNISCGYC
jgi:hypothetical protein